MKLTNEVQKEVLDSIEEMDQLRKSCIETIQRLRERIFGELCPAIKEAPNGKTVNGNNMPSMLKLNELQGNLKLAQTAEQLNMLQIQLQNINEEISWAIEDAKAGQVSQFVDVDKNAEAEKKKLLEERIGLESKYELAKKDFEDARDAVKKMPQKDDQEFERYIGLYKQAMEAFKKKQVADALKKMLLAHRLMENLRNNPMGSMVTGRGQEHLKELNIRWSNSIGTLTNSLSSLSGLIEVSCKAATDEIKDPGSITKKFDERVSKQVEKQFDPAAFQRELLVLQGAAPEKKADQPKDLENKKKYREQALAKVRDYKRLVSKHPTFQLVMFQNSPWSKQGGRVNAMDLMRALNDIDLNVQRGVG